MPTDNDRVGRRGRTTGIEDLLRRYRRRKTTALRHELVERHREIVEAMAHSLAQRLPRSVDTQDLVHAGIWGLMQALDKFELARSGQFSSFMRIRVRGAMIDELRNMDFLPRLYRRRLRDRDAAVHRLRAELQREPSETELAAELGVTVDTLQRSYVKRGELMAMTREDVYDQGDGWDSMDLLADNQSEAPIEALSRQELVDKIQQSLEPIEWKVLRMHYLEGLSGKEVARRLQLSAARICQIHGRVLTRLKSRLRAIAV